MNNGSKHKILFYNKGEPYYEFTNFIAGYPIVLDNTEWATTEHFFQANKFTDYPQLQEQIRQMKTAREVFDFARGNDAKKRSDWKQVKVDIMYTAVKAKFTKHEKLRDLLLDTGDAELIENSPYDSYWGIGGGNMLGKLLMKVREEERNRIAAVN